MIPFAPEVREKLRGKLLADGRALAVESRDEAFVTLVFCLDEQSCCRIRIPVDRYDFTAIKRRWDESI